MAQVDRVPSTLSHIAIDLDLNNRALLAANAAVAARARGDFVGWSPAFNFVCNSERLIFVVVGDSTLASSGDTMLTSSATWLTTTHSLPSAVVTREPFFSTCRSCQ